MNLTIDEAMCPFRGRTSFRVYMKNKPNKYGIKLYALCNSSTGCMLNCDVYTGSARSVDNSIQDLVKRKLHLLAVKWKSKRDVFCLSTKHKSNSTSIQVRTKGGIAEIVKPTVIIDYNKNKARVDRADQCSSYYPFARKTLKWCFILYKENTRKNVSLVDFIHRVEKKLAEKGGNIFQQQAASSSQIERTFARHFPEKVPPTANKVNTTRYCKVCSDRGKKETGKCIRKESGWWCKDCGFDLCDPQCFQDFHTKANYI
ncbi:piggyBac transposable element-derived protein 4-like [Schistocerca serialis cubense]|uniref:piggyBac transposable element-derived protein 4-like n=1 Tax=Schistocerca serialis cubense TaxID=2023355 RepID=UPI00214F2557|nr:piggyBac transposable element-derived protein 4-like [Schistocerca serialis cubense]